MKKKINNKAFTLIELIAVIIILGILMIIAIPSVTKYISDSRKATYVQTAKNIANGAKIMVNEGKFSMLDTNVTYYIDASCISTENGSKSPYGEFDPAYVVVIFNGRTHVYFWTSRDTTGQGVKRITKVDDLTEDSIVSDIKKDDILNNVGLDKREYYQLIDGDCTVHEPEEVRTNISSEVGEIKFICVRAQAGTLHQEKCTQGSKFCASTVGKNNYTTFGQVGTKGTLSTGDAFDCDVNGDKIFDPNSERFYYVSDYFDTKASANGENTYDSEYAVLIYYSHYNGGPVQSGIAYNSVSNNYSGPKTAISALPDSGTWKNVSLKETERQILGEFKENHNKTAVKNNKPLPEYSYEGKSARLLTVQELMAGCGIGNVGDARIGVLNNCLFLLENSKYSSSSNPTYGFWLETASTNDLVSTYRVNSEKMEVLTSNTNATNKGARPAIEVEKIYIDY